MKRQAPHVYAPAGNSKNAGSGGYDYAKSYKEMRLQVYL